MTGTVFEEILREVVKAVPGAKGAIFIDWEGEAVDVYSTIGNTNIRLMGAHWGIVYHHARAALKKIGQGGPQELVMNFSQLQVIIRRVTDDYVVIFTLRPGCHLGRALGVLDWAEEKLRAEM